MESALPPAKETPGAGPAETPAAKVTVCKAALFVCEICDAESKYVAANGEGVEKKTSFILPFVIRLLESGCYTHPMLRSKHHL